MQFRILDRRGFVARLATASSLVAGLLLASCGAATAPTTTSAGAPAATAAPTSSPAAHPLKPVTLLLDWIVEGYHAPFYLGIAKGFYKHAGLDVTIVPGKGSLNTVGQVGHGNYDFGFADAATAADAIAKGIPIKVVADYFQKSPLAVISLASSHITKPQDLIGKTVGGVPGGATVSLFPAFLTVNHVSRNQITFENTSSSTNEALLQDKKVDAILDFGIDVLPVLDKQHIAADQMLYADWGVSTLSNGLETSTAFLQQHPKTVRAFVQASDRAWTYSETHQAEAVADEKAATSVAPGAAESLKLAYQLMHTANSQDQPIGWMSAKDWAATLALLQKYEGMKPGMSASAVYTDQFVASGR